jgi:mannose-1-phosphate guanylyltransferase
MTNRTPELTAVIMAGGSGTRFWPLSRRKKPKQFLPIAGRRTMIEETVARILPVIPYRKILTVAGSAHTRTIRRLLPRLPAKNALIEPLGKNTAPSLILATASVYLRNPRAVVVVLASDHLISDPDLFRHKLLAAAAAADARECLVTFGVPPAFPATGYGYIHYRKEKPWKTAGDSFYSVLEFKEKPGLEQAQAFLDEGGYYWNSGMFLWRADVFAHKLEQDAPDFFPFWEKTLAALKAKSPARLKKIFQEMPATSIDYALMEKARGVVVCEGDFGWSDVGAWSSLYDVWKQDAAGNAFQGQTLAIETTGTLCFNPGKFTALIGCRDLIIVDTKDALLICPRSQDQRVKHVLEHLIRVGGKKHL